MGFAPIVLSKTLPNIQILWCYLTWKWWDLGLAPFTTVAISHSSGLILFEQLLRRKMCTFIFVYFGTKLQTLQIKSNSKIKEKWIKKFIDTSRVKLIISEEAIAGVLEKLFLKIAFLKFATSNLQSKFLKNTYAENKFL